MKRRHVCAIFFFCLGFLVTSPNGNAQIAPTNSILPMFTRGQGAENLNAKTTQVMESALAQELAPERIRGGLYAEIGFLLVKPHFQSNPAFQTTNAVGAALVGSQREFDYDYTFNPQVWIGYESACGLGVRGHWWRFDQSASEAAAVGAGGFATPATPLGLGGAILAAPGDTVSATTRLQLEVFDLEGTCRWDVANTWSFLFGAGVRYATLGQDYGFSATTPGVGAIGLLNSSRRYDGVGPTLSIDGRRNIGNTGIGLYGCGRGAVLFGTTNQTADVSNIPFGGGALTFTGANEANRSDVLSQLEFEVGSDYIRTIGRGQLYLKAGFVGQVWYGGGNATNTDSTFTGNTNNSSSFGFMGLALRAGFKY